MLRMYPVQTGYRRRRKKTIIEAEKGGGLGSKVDGQRNEIDNKIVYA